MKPIYIIPFLLLCISVKAQECGTDATHKYLYATDSNYAKSYRAYSKQLSTKQSKQQNTTTYKTTEARTYTIPVVVHVLHSGEPIGDTNNPTDIQIKTMIDSVNYMFRNTQLQSGHKGLFELKLATKDPECNATNGIERINYYDLPTNIIFNRPYNDGYKLNNIYNTYGWPSGRYYNIWIVKQINNGKYSGYAYYPWATHNDYTVIKQKVVTENSGVLVHEIGHAFGLMHVFEGDNDSTICPTDTDCKTMGDMVCDTDPCIRYPDCNNPINPCTGTPYNGLESNYMNYTKCSRKNITLGQFDRMVYYANSIERRSLFESNAVWEEHIDQPVAAACNPTSNRTSLGYIGHILFKDIALNISSNTVGKPYDDKTCLYNTELNGGKDYRIEIGTYATPSTIVVYIDYNNDGFFDEQELVSSGTLLSKWIYIDTINIREENFVPDHPLRMRIICSNGSNDIQPCGDIGSGSSIDFSVTIRPSAINNNNEFAMYPNPVVNVLTISGKADLTGAECFVYSTTGQIMKKITGTTPIIRLDVSSLAAGVYLLKTQLPDGSRKINRFVKY